MDNHTVDRTIRHTMESIDATLTKIDAVMHKTALSDALQHTIAVMLSTVARQMMVTDEQLREVYISLLDRQTMLEKDAHGR